MTAERATEVGTPGQAGSGQSGAVRRELGFLAGRVHLAPDFDAPLPDDLAAAFGMAGADGTTASTVPGKAP